jgi:hypothetical protein
MSAVTTSLMTIVFRLLADYPVLIGLIYLAVCCTEGSLMIVLQPYFAGFTNDLFVAASFGTIWAGVCYLIVAAAGNGVSGLVYPSMASAFDVRVAYSAALLLCLGLPLACLGGFWASRKYRERLIAKTLSRYSHRLESIPRIPDDNVFPVIASKYDRYESVPFWQSFQAALVEVPLRFLQKDRSSRALAIAEHILKQGLLKHPQSAYLRLQYVTFGEEGREVGRERKNERERRKEEGGKPS